MLWVLFVEKDAAITLEYFVGQDHVCCCIRTPIFRKLAERTEGRPATATRSDGANPRPAQGIIPKASVSRAISTATAISTVVVRISPLELIGLCHLTVLSVRDLEQAPRTPEAENRF